MIFVIFPRIIFARQATVGHPEMVFARGVFGRNVAYHFAGANEKPNVFVACIFGRIMDHVARFGRVGHAPTARQHGFDGRRDRRVCFIDPAKQTQNRRHDQRARNVAIARSVELATIFIFHIQMPKQLAVRQRFDRGQIIFVI